MTKVVGRREVLRLASTAAAAAWASPTPAEATTSFKVARRSGLAWHSSAFGNQDAFATWRNRPLDGAVSFVPHDNWTDIAAFPANTTFSRFANIYPWISLGYPCYRRMRASLASGWPILLIPATQITQSFMHDIQVWQKVLAEQVLEK